MINAIIINKERKIRKDIRSKLELYFMEDIRIVAEASSILEGIKAIHEFKPNLLFLDVHLSDGIGFDVVTKSTYKDFDVIFITDSDTYAIKAIRAGALDYILKPVDDTELKDAVMKAIEKKKKDGLLGGLIDVPNKSIHKLKDKRVILKTSEAVYAIKEDDINYCQSDGNYTTLHMKASEKIILSKPIKKIEELLSDTVFIRCHQSFLVNKNHVLKYNNKQGSLILNNNMEIPVSVRRVDYTIRKVFS